MVSANMMHQSDAEQSPSPSNVRIVRGYRPGLISECLQMHMDYYPRLVGFGAVFEAQVAHRLADLVSRLDNPKNGAWSAVERAEEGREKIVGTVFIDGEDLGLNRAHLRLFIVDGRVRGGGIGRRLLARAVEFVDEMQFEDTQLNTFQGLDEARRLYESVGFVLVKEAKGDSRGKEVLEQVFIRKK